MSEDPEARHITLREFKSELKSFRNETRVLIVGVLVVLRFDVPKELTAAALVGAVLGAVGKSAWALFAKS